MLDVIILTIVTIIILGYYWLKRQYQFWENHGVPYLKSPSLIYGNYDDFFRRRSTLADLTVRLYNALAPHKFGGIYILNKPVLYVRDPEVIKNVLIKDFNHFVDRFTSVAVKHDPFTLGLANMGGEEWKYVRNKLSPTFTASKMKQMCGLINEHGEQLVKIIEESALSHEPVKVKGLMTRFSMAVISSCAFGLEAGSLHNPDSEFLTFGKAIFAPTVRTKLREWLFMLSPRLVHFLRFTLLPRHVLDFFVNIVKNTMEYRTKNGIVRNDFLNILMNVKNEEKSNNDSYFNRVENLTGLCFSFFVGGYESSSSFLGFILFELARHQEIQRKLQEEVDSTLKKYNGQITYDCLNEMDYMDKIFKETSRLYPITPFVRRTCTEDYRFPDSDYVMKKGQTLIIPSYSLHRDPKYYPDPNAFNPENFSEEAKAARPACCFLPFGDGPRNCIGMRFGIMQVKFGLTIIMKEYAFTLAPEMKLPMEMQLGSIFTRSKHEILLNFTLRGTGQ